MGDATLDPPRGGGGAGVDAAGGGESVERATRVPTEARVCLPPSPSRAWRPAQERPHASASHTLRVQ
eukprot:3472235-Pyramimonas_sp.AAC.3